MCGIFGGSAIEKATLDPVKLKFLAFLSESRGLHSTGFCSIDSDNKIKITKLLVKPSIAILNDEFVSDLSNKKTIIGHNRAATVGAVTLENAHPFDFESGEYPNGAKSPSTERVIGVHNGFVADKTTDQFEFKTPFNVDSQYIFAMLARWGGDPAVLKLLEGAVTIAYTVPDKYKNTTFLYRRTPRELHLGFSKEGIYYASEKLPLEIIGCSDIFELENLSLTTLKDGRILDYSILEPPKLKSIKFNAQRLSYMDDLPEEELNHFPEIKKSVVKYSKWSNEAAQQTTIFPDPKLLESYKTATKDIVQDLKDDLAKYVPNEIPSFRELDSYSDTDFNCCIVLLKFMDNIHNNPVPGLFVVDSVLEDINSITVLNGVAALKFDNKHCGQDRNIIIYDPVDSLLTWTIRIKPSSSELQEIVIELPYTKKKKNLGLRIISRKQTYRANLIDWTRVEFLNCVYYLLQMNMYKIPEIIQHSIAKMFERRENRWIHEIRENKFMGHRDRVKGEKELYRLLAEEIVAVALAYRY